MTVEEMRNKIRNKCLNIIDCYIENCPLLKEDYEDYSCFGEDLTDEEIKRNYELMFGKEKSEMKSEFDFNELKAGYAIKIPVYKDELLVAIPVKDKIIFYSKMFRPIVNKEQILNKEIYKGCPLEEKYIPIEVYGFSDDSEELFDPSTRPLLWKKEDMNFKIYKIGNLEIKPNYEKGTLDPEIKGYKTEKEDFLFIENMNEYEDEYIIINKSELNDVINALTEIRDFIKED